MVEEEEERKKKREINIPESTAKVVLSQARVKPRSDPWKEVNV